MYYTDYEKVGKRIAKRRKELGYTQWQLEEKANLGFKYLSNIERAKTVLSVDVLMRICDALEITPDYLLVGTTNTNNPNTISAAISSQVNRMSPKQTELALSIMDWILTQKLD